MVAEEEAAADFRVVGDFLTYADYALMFRKNDPDFAEVVDRAFQKLAGQPRNVAIYERAGSRSRYRRVCASICR
jgi:glutamate/aspartate transport system substrate-binding protein